MVKLDIEGAEPRAWQGMQEIVRRHRPVLLFEFSPELLRVTGHIEPAAFLDKIVDAGYALYLLSMMAKRVIFLRAGTKYCWRRGVLDACISIWQLCQPKL